MTTKHYSAKETAAMIRTALKAAYPKVKFSVRSRTFSMGSSVDISWVDGPTFDDVNKVTAPFNGVSFDGMTDSKSYDNSGHGSWICPQRTFSVDFLKRRMESVLRNQNVNVSAVSVVDTGFGAHVRDTMAQTINGDYLDHLVHQAAHRMRGVY